MKIIETERLILRLWCEEDVRPYWQINQDPKVTEFLPSALTKEQAAQFITRANKQFTERGYTLWAAELKATGELIGFIGLNYTDFEAPFTPAVEIGWRLDSKHWGKGYATEGAKAAISYGFNQAGLEEIVSFTAPANQRSIRVMERLGMQRDLAGDFAHPKLPHEHPFSQHILYKINSL